VRGVVYAVQTRALSYTVNMGSRLRGRAGAFNTDNNNEHAQVTGLERRQQQHRFLLRASARGPPRRISHQVFVVRGGRALTICSGRLVCGCRCKCVCVCGFGCFRFKISVRKNKNRHKSADVIGISRRGVQRKSGNRQREISVSIPVIEFIVRRA